MTSVGGGLTRLRSACGVVPGPEVGPAPFERARAAPRFCRRDRDAPRHSIFCARRWPALAGNLVASGAGPQGCPTPDAALGTSTSPAAGRALPFPLESLATGKLASARTPQPDFPTVADPHGPRAAPTRRRVLCLRARPTGHPAPPPLQKQAPKSRSLHGPGHSDSGQTATTSAVTISVRVTLSSPRHRLPRSHAPQPISLPIAGTAGRRAAMQTSSCIGRLIGSRRSIATRPRGFLGPFLPPLHSRDKRRSVPMIGPARPSRCQNPPGVPVLATRPPFCAVSPPAPRLPPPPSTSENAAAATGPQHGAPPAIPIPSPPSPICAGTPGHAQLSPVPAMEESGSARIIVPDRAPGPCLSPTRSRRTSRDHGVPRRESGLQYC